MPVIVVNQIARSRPDHREGRNFHKDTRLRAEHVKLIEINQRPCGHLNDGGLIT